MISSLQLNFQNKHDWKRYTPTKVLHVINKPSKKVKTGAIIGTFAGVLTSLFLIAKCHGFSVNPIKIARTNPRQWALNLMEYQEKEVLPLAAGSIIGGLIGGSLADKKENHCAKYKEAVTQMVGNFIVPTIFVGGGIRAFKSLEKHKTVPEMKALRFAAGMGSLIAGVLCGNRISNVINEKIFKKEHNRKVKPADWALQLDNTCLTLSLAASGTSIARTASKIIPIAHLIPGYSIGTMQEKDNCNKT